jgi:SnoaL-like domain
MLAAATSSLRAVAGRERIAGFSGFIGLSNVRLWHGPTSAQAALPGQRVDRLTISATPMDLDSPDTLWVRLAVLDCVDQYSHLFDGGHFGPLAELFAPDAVFDISPVPAFMRVPLRGRDKIIENISRRYAEVTASGERHQHVCTNTVFDEISGLRCATRTYLTSLAAPSGAPPVLATFGTYHDVFTREGERWVFAKRHLRTETAIP